MEHPAETLELAVRCKNAGADTKVFGPVARALSILAAQDRESAQRKLEDFTGPLRAAAVSGFGEGWARQDPAAALEWLSTLPASDRSSSGRSYASSSDVLDLAFQDWMERDPEKARAWTDQLPAGELRQRMQGRVAQSYARSGDPAEGMQILAGLGAAADANTARNLARSWATKNGLAAADWVVSQASPELQAEALPMIVKTWSDQDENAVAAWVAQFPEGKTHDRCVMEFLHRSTILSAPSREVVKEFDGWFETMTDPRLRADAAVANLYFRKMLDPAAAESWLASLQNVDQQVIQKALHSKKR